MRGIKRFFAFIMSAALLCGCSRTATETVPATTRSDFSISVQTFGTAEETTVSEAETLNISDITKPETEPYATERSYRTDAATEKTEASPVSSDDGYGIAPASLTMKATSSVNVREQPDAGSRRIGRLDKGERIEVTGFVSNGWARVIYEGEEAYINASYLSADEPSETKAPEKTAAPTTETTTVSTEPTTVTSESATAATEPTTAYTTEPSVTTTTEPEKEVLTEPEPGEILINPNYYSALNYPVQKAVWLAYLDIDGMIKNASEQDFRQKIAAEYDKIVGLGCNTVYVHVRSFGDAYYYSSIFPFSAAYSDVLGQAPGYDPLRIMIDEAHSRGLSFHAWINPMRTTTKERYAEMGDFYTLKQWYNSDATNGKFLVYDSETDYYWLSPAYPAVRALITNGVSEIVSNYNVDGIHIDDYFYPTTSPSFDKAAFEASGRSDLAQWRKEVVSSLVKEIYATVKACNSSVLFGVSPQGNVENNRDRLYADVERWCSETGYLDYIVPQIYYGFNDKLPFDQAAAQWRELVTAPGVKLICGIAAYKVGTNKEWSSGTILSDETEYAKQIGFGGVAYYRCGSLFGSANSGQRLMEQELPGLARAISEY